MHPAETTARAVALSFPKGEDRSVAHCRDTSFPDSPSCFVTGARESSALVVYEDEPDAIVSTGNHPGRFEAVASAA
jgi:hypothetical protein